MKTNDMSRKENELLQRLIRAESSRKWQSSLERVMALKDVMADAQGRYWVLECDADPIRNTYRSMEADTAFASRALGSLEQRFGPLYAEAFHEVVMKQKDADKYCAKHHMDVQDLHETVHKMTEYLVENT